jgi:APA family basic amino acid/polyamine antiporter
MVRASDAGTDGLGLWPAIALVVGHTIGIGIFLTPAELLGAVASPGLTIGLWVACGGLVLAGAFTFGELASRYPQAGGLYIYLREGWGERIAFLYGWQSLLIMDPGVAAALASGMSEYAVVLWPSAQGASRWLAIGTIWVLAVLSIGGLKLSTRVLAAMTALKCLAFAGVVAAAFAAPDGSWSHFRPLIARHLHTVPLAEAMALGLVSVFFSFGGFWEASRIANEVRDARRTMPVALVAGVACVTAVYVATTIGLVYAVPVQQVTSASAFARLAGEAMLGPAGPGTLAVIVVLSVLTSLLALMIMAPRLYLAMSRDGLFPTALATVDRATRAPVRATLLLAGLASVFAYVGTFQQILAFFMCTTLAFVALAAGSLIVVRRRGGAGAPFQTPGYPLAPVLFIVLVAVVVLLVAMNRPVQAFAGFALVLLGVPFHGRFARASGAGG